MQNKLRTIKKKKNIILSLTQLYNEMTWQSLIYFYRLHNTDLQYNVAFKIKILLF